MNKLLGIMFGITIVFGITACTYFLMGTFEDSPAETTPITKTTNTNTILKLTNLTQDAGEKLLQTFFGNISQDEQEEVQSSTDIKQRTFINRNDIKGVIGSKYAFIINPQEESGVVIDLETGEMRTENNIKIATTTPNGILIVKERTLYYYEVDDTKPELLEGSGLSMTETYFGDLNDKAKIELDGSNVTAYVFDFFDIQVKTSIYELDRPKKVLRILSFDLD